MLEQHVIPVEEFAEAMLAVDPDFAARVDGFRTSFGPVSSRTLGLLAQAAYFCDVHCDHPTNLWELCEAIGAETPSSLMYHCGQISQDWWDLLHNYVVAGQLWGGVDRPIPEGLDAGKIRMISSWFGSKDDARKILMDLYLDHLIGSLLDMDFSRLGWTTRQDRPYVDHSAWYTGADGKTYPSGRRDKVLAEECRSKLQETLSSIPCEIDKIVEGITALSPPPCVCKYTRYLDIQATSIGALTWRGNLPVQDEHTSFITGRFLKQAIAGLESWRDGLPPGGDIAEQVHESLGIPTERKKAIVSTFLNIGTLTGSRECSEQACDWLGKKVQERRTQQENSPARNGAAISCR
jgi:hypothetical protein